MTALAARTHDTVTFHAVELLKEASALTRRRHRHYQPWRRRTRLYRSAGRCGSDGTRRA